MSTQKSTESQPAAGEDVLRGEVGPQDSSAVDHMEYVRKRKPDQELRLDGEKDTLYDDGLDIDTDVEPLAGTDGPGPKGIKG